jgi:superfamily II DNA or RNA helicase
MKMFCTRFCFNFSQIYSRINDKRYTGIPIDVKFSGELYEDQLQAANEVLKHDNGVLSVPTAFRKTVIGIYVLAARRVNTLILVHRRQLLDQWLERLSTFLNLDSNSFVLPPESTSSSGLKML